MAQKVSIILIDDIDGSEATETVRFGLDGANYEVDLNDKNAKKLRDALAGYVGAARKVSARRSGRGRGSTGSGSYSPADIRAWARDNDYDVPTRGRIPAPIREAFEAAH